METCSCPRRETLALAAVLAGFVPIQARASGFAFHDQSVRATGMAGAFVALSDDPSAVYYNPAGLGFGSGGAVEAGVEGIWPRQSFTDPAGQETPASGEASFLPAAFGRYALGAGWNAGIGVYYPFATGWAWPDGWEGRSIVTHGSLTALYVTPSLAWRPVPEVSLGAGVSYVRGSVDWNFQTPAAPGDNIGSQLGGTADAAAFSVGALWRPESLPISVGATYRSQTLLRFRGAMAFNPPSPLLAQFPDSAASADLPLPDAAVLGAAWKAGPDWTVSVEGQWTGWGEFRQIVVVPDSGLPEPRIVLDERWMDAWTGRLGAEWRVLPAIRVRAGYAAESASSPRITLDPFGADAPRQLASLGGDWSSGPHTVALALSATPFQQRTTRTNLAGFQGTYRTLLDEVGLGYRFSF